MKLKVLFSATYDVVGAMDGDACPTEVFIASGQAATKASRLGLSMMLETAARCGLQGVPPAWFHEADKQNGIYEFIKGDLRLFFFKGEHGDIAVCCLVAVKKGQKADKEAVNRAIRWKKEYYSSTEPRTYLVIEDES